LTQYVERCLGRGTGVAEASVSHAKEIKCHATL
jgi:hypothetical protein